MDYYGIPPARLGEQSKIPLLCLGDSGEVFYELALEMIRVIEENNRQGKKTVLICPVGPVGQYPIFVRLINQQKISLRNCWFLNMDEYLTDDGCWLEENNPLSFRGFMSRNVYGRIDPSLAPPEEQRIFPHPQKPDEIGALLEKLGGVDITVGGIGINGHLAFNEPEEVSAEDFARRRTRVVRISPETRTVNCVGDLGGALETMPRWCVTLGMREILAAKKIRLGVFREWHRAVVRRAAYGEVTARFPASLCQNHPDAQIIVNQTAAGLPY